MSSVNKAGDRGLPKIRRISVNRPGASTRAIGSGSKPNSVDEPQDRNTTLLWPRNAIEFTQEDGKFFLCRLVE